MTASTASSVTRATSRPEVVAQGSESRHLVLLPGLNNTGAVFARLRRALAPWEGVQVRTPDNPALPDTRAIARSLLEALPDRFWLAGFSFGGYVAMAVLEAAPERVEGLALVCSAPGGESPGAALRRQTALEALALGHYFEMVQAQAGSAFHPDSLRDATLMRERAAMVRDYGPDRYAAHLRAAMKRPDLSALIDGSRPTLAVSSVDDAVFPPAAMAWAEQRPGVHHERIAGAGHLVPMEQPQALARVLATWMGLP